MGRVWHRAVCPAPNHQDLVRNSGSLLYTQSSEPGPPGSVALERSPETVFKNALFLVLIMVMHMCLCGYVHVCVGECGCLQRPVEGGALRVGVTGGCEPPDVGAKNQIPVLCE